MTTNQLEVVGEEHDAVRTAIEACGARLLFFPAYSPDFSPIEHAFSKVKAILRQLRAHTPDSLLDALSLAIDRISAQDTIGYFIASRFTELA